MKQLDLHKGMVQILRVAFLWVVVQGTVQTICHCDAVQSAGDASQCRALCMHPAADCAAECTAVHCGDVFSSTETQSWKTREKLHQTLGTASS